MKKSVWITIALTALTVIALTRIELPTALGQEKPASTPKWTYKIVVQTELNASALNDLGNEGWEIVSVSLGHDYIKSSVTGPKFGKKDTTETENTIEKGKSVFVLKRQQ